MQQNKPNKSTRTNLLLRFRHIVEYAYCMRVPYRLTDLTRATPRRMAVRVKANLPGNSAAYAIFLLPIHNKKIFDHENEGQGQGINYSQWSHSMTNMSKYQLKTLGQGDVVEKKDLRRSICKLHRSHNVHFCANCYSLREINILNF